METKTTTSADGTTIAYHVHGSGATTLVMVHGWMVSSAVFDHFVAAMGDADVSLVTIDLRGSGASQPAASDYSIPRYVEDVAAVLRDMDASSVVLLGHSMGGQIVQVVAAEHPSRVHRLILVNPVPTAGIPLPEEIVELFSSSGGDRDKQGAIVDMACLHISPEDREALLDDAATIDAGCIAKSFAAWSEGGLEEHLPKIEAETLVIGTDDPFLPPDFLKAAVVEPIAQASFHHIAGPGHYPLIEDVSATRDAVMSFLG